MDDSETIGPTDYAKRLATLEKENRELKAKAYIDSITGLLNENYFEERVKQIIAGYLNYPDNRRSSQRDAILCLADVNGLKSINDSLGHEVGDGAIIAVADALSEAVRNDVDIVGKYKGGDEFFILIRLEKSVDSPDELIDVLKNRAAQLIHCEFPVSFSVGGVMISNYETVDEVIAAADKALYEDKIRTKTKTS